MTRGISRRAFLGATAASGAAVLTNGFGALADAAPDPAPSSADWIDASITQLQALMNSRRLPSRELTKAYLDRIARLNPLLHAVIETNDEALAIASQRDAERR